MNPSDDIKKEFEQGQAVAEAELAAAERAAKVEANKIKSQFGAEFTSERDKIEHDFFAAGESAKNEVNKIRTEVADDFREIEDRAKADVKSFRSRFLDGWQHFTHRIKDSWFAFQVWISNNGQKLVWFMNKFAEAIFKRTKKSND